MGRWQGKYNKATWRGRTEEIQRIASVFLEAAQVGALNAVDVTMASTRKQAARAEQRLGFLRNHFPGKKPLQVLVTAAHLLEGDDYTETAHRLRVLAMRLEELRQAVRKEG